MRYSAHIATQLRRVGRTLLNGHRRKQPGQALQFFALALLFLVPFAMMAVEAGGRIMQRQEVEDALQQANRSAVQLFQYNTFATNSQRLRTAAQVKTLAKEMFATNLENVGGLKKTPQEVAALVQWEIYPTGGTCKDGTTSTYPLICATLDVPMLGLTGEGVWTPHIETAATTDQSR
jgi:Flp pilus assembly protein TadG